MKEDGVPLRLKRSGQTISNTAAWKEGQKEKLKKRGGAAGRDEKAGGARSTLGPASRALLSCLCTPQLADIILAALPGGVSAEVSTVTRLGPPPPPLHLHPPSCVGPSPKRSPSLKSPLHHVSRARDPTALVSMVTGKLFVSCGSK